MRFLISISGILFLMGGPVAAENLILNSPGKQFVQQFDGKLGRKTRNALREFKTTKSFFGAFAASTTEDDVKGWAAGMHDLAAARADAMAICRQGAKDPSNCVEVALMLPKGYDASVKGTSLSQGAQNALRGKFKNRQKTGKYGALAINGGFNFGFSWGYDDLNTAKEQAKLQCEASAARSKVNTPIAIRKAIPIDKRLACRLVYTVQGG